ncbi:hypothetical protein PTSG_01375 [Salpingoeca rosetta]|uniref:Uncharacterized protein n=1 Tax=Salpingoeca rosetta (strain ATCC 50818 / BSB-021) TaxID=946362 RepID=F2U059_SALR5|nr:uncharacterized protein PTSG_01375 [Salpingoeca rosetta]EGD80787.1 hypothetical protein PTSG_01375 [Salpingoeca rosetta]|eukprot:XP_004997348.1 hypothetical protein PTSG_01375 [Salpingoeca rosetta]
MLRSTQQHNSTPTAVFISFEASDAGAQARALQRRLRDEQVCDAVFMSPPLAHRNSHEAIHAACSIIKNVDVIIMLGSELYGHRSAERFSSHEELRFILKEKANKHTCLVHMCTSFRDTATEALLAQTEHHSFLWLEAADPEARNTPPEGLIQTIRELVARPHSPPPPQDHWQPQHYQPPLTHELVVPPTIDSTAHVSALSQRPWTGPQSPSPALYQPHQHHQHHHDYHHHLSVTAPVSHTQSPAMTPPQQRRLRRGRSASVPRPPPQAPSASMSPAGSHEALTTIPEEGIFTLALRRTVSLEEGLVGPSLARRSGDSDSSNETLLSDDEQCGNGNDDNCYDGGCECSNHAERSPRNTQQQQPQQQPAGDASTSARRRGRARSLSDAVPPHPSVFIQPPELDNSDNDDSGNGSNDSSNHNDGAVKNKLDNSDGNGNSGNASKHNNAGNNDDTNDDSNDEHDTSSIDKDTRAAVKATVEPILGYLSRNINDPRRYVQGLASLITYLHEQPAEVSACVCRDRKGRYSIMAAMRAHGSNRTLQRLGCYVFKHLANLCFSDDDGDDDRDEDVDMDNDATSNHHHEDEDEDEDEEERDLRAFFMVVPSVVLLAMWQHQDDSGVQKYACQMLEVMVRADKQVRQRVLQNAGVSAVTMALNEHPLNIYVQAAGCAVLSTMARFQDQGLCEIVTTRGPALMLEALEYHGNDAHVVGVVCNCLASIVEGARRVHERQQQRRCQPRHGRHRGELISHKASTAIAEVLSVEWTCTTTAAVMDAMSNHRLDAVMQEMGLRALLSLQPQLSLQHDTEHDQDTPRRSNSTPANIHVVRAQLRDVATMTMQQFSALNDIVVLCRRLLHIAP